MRDDDIEMEKNMHSLDGEILVMMNMPNDVKRS